MCIKRIRKGYREGIEEEKNIKVRERYETDIQRKSIVLLAILMSGNIFATYKSSFSIFSGIFYTLLLLVLYLFLENFYLRDHSRYTDELIKKEAKKI